MRPPEIPTVDAATLARMVDHTLLRPEATTAEVVALCEEASRLGVGAVCVSPSVLPLPDGVLAPGIKVAAVVGFPSGAHFPGVKSREAAVAVGAYADEVDVVMNLGWAMEGNWYAVEQELAAVRADVGPDVVVKVIVESAVIGPERIAAACRAAEEAGADYVKTSTGFHPAGGATVEAVRLMAETVGGRLGVKASGGIRTAEAALAMVGAGATRLGTSSTAAILAGLDGTGA